MKNNYDLSNKVIINFELESFVFKTLIECVKERNGALKNVLGSVDESSDATKAVIAYSYEQVLERLKSMIYIKRKDDPKNEQELIDLCRITFNSNERVGVSKNSLEEYVNLYETLNKKYRKPVSITPEFISNLYEYIKKLVIYNGISLRINLPKECDLDLSDAIKCCITNIYEAVEGVLLESVYIEKVTAPVNQEEFRDFIDKYYANLCTNLVYLKQILNNSTLEKYNSVDEKRTLVKK